MPVLSPPRNVEDTRISEDPALGRWQRRLPDGRAQCLLCPRECRLKPGQRGFCAVRSCHEDGMVHLDVYGKSSGFAIDPVEKKPLNHFLPGADVLSFGTIGCNSNCQFCQNWHIARAREWEYPPVDATPNQIARAAVRRDAQAIAFTYNDPIVFAEYAIDTARAAHEAGVKTIAVSAGYMSLPAARDFYQVMDAANIDLKGFDEDFYRRRTGTHAKNVLDIIEYVANETDCWLELTTLLIPGLNDDADEIRRECDWITEHIGPDVPVHFTAFHPAYRMKDTPPTPPATVARARQIALDAGIHYPYVGNVHDTSGETTVCPNCHAALIERDWNTVTFNHLTPGGACPRCRTPIPGVWR